MTNTELLNSYPSLIGDGETTDSDRLHDLKEWAESARAALQAGPALSEFPAWRKAMEDIATLKKQLFEATERAEQAERHRSELHIRIRQTLSAESTEEAFEEIVKLKAKCLELARDRDQALEIARGDAQRCAEATQQLAEVVRLHAEARAAVLDSTALVKEARTELADRAAYIEALEVEVHMVERLLERAESSLEGERAGTRFATTTDSLATIQRAEIVVDVENGKVVKNRRGPAVAWKPRTSPR